MSVTATTMKCPACGTQTLESLSAPIGILERCSACGGISIHQDIVVAASPEPAACRNALEETKTLLLPTDRWCPKCLQKLFDGRVRSRSVIFTLCPVCQSLWTSLPLLKQFEEPVEKTLRRQIEIATNSGGKDASAAPASRSIYSSESDSKADSGFAGVFRGLARLFNRLADTTASPPADAFKKKPAPAKPPPKQPDKKPLIVNVEPAPPPAKERIPEPGPPKIEIPEFIFPEEPVVEEKPIREEPPAPKPEPVVERPAPEPMPKAPVPPPEPDIETPGEPVLAAPVPMSAPVIPEPQPSPAPKPAPIVAKPIKAIDVPQPKPKEGLGKKLANLFSPKPKPKPRPKPVPPASSVEPAKPAMSVQPLKPMPVPQPKPAGGFGKKLAALFNPKPKLQVPKPAATVAPVKPVETVPPIEDVKPVEPSKPPKAVPAVKSAKSAPLPKPPKPKREKPPKSPVDPVALWPPWVLGTAGVVCSSFRDFGFEGSPAALWGICGWSIGMMVRLSRLYPFQSFEASTLADLSALPDAQKRRAIPVILKGQIVLKREEEPKGEVIFKQEDRTLALNRMGRWDIIPRLFGLSNPRQLLKGDVTIKGWYRGGLAPFLEVQEVRADNTMRRSMSRSLRWASAVLVLSIALVVYFSLE